ncbi:MAG: flagellar biosynthesis anti-sigma factor FlgM [Pirellulaceae bacterium]
MNINDLPGGSPERIPGNAAKIHSPHTRFDSRTSDRSVTDANSVNAQHARDPELVGLVQKLAETPEIRTDRIAEVQQKIQSGEFFSRQSAELTAEAFLR